MGDSGFSLRRAPDEQSAVFVFGREPGNPGAPRVDRARLHNLLWQDRSLKVGIAAKRLTAAWDKDCLCRLIGLDPKPGRMQSPGTVSISLIRTFTQLWTGRLPVCHRVWHRLIAAPRGTACPLLPVASGQNQRTCNSAPSP